MHACVQGHGRYKVTIVWTLIAYIPFPLFADKELKKIEGQKEKDKKRKGERKELKGRKWKRMKSTKR